MRCPDCCKFVSFDEPEVEAGLEADDGTVHGSVRVVLKCAECGSELKETQTDVDQSFSHECPKAGKDGEAEFEIEGDSIEDMQRTQTNDRHGRPIKSSRYMKTFYGFSGICTVRCCQCDEEIEVSIDGECQASGFGELT